MGEIVSEYIIRSITGLKASERKNVFSWISSIPEQEAIDIFQSSVKASFSLQKARPDMPGKVVKYCSFITAARKKGWNTFRGKGFRVASQPQFTDFTHMRKAKVADLLQSGRRPVLRKKVLAYWGEITELRRENHSFRAISSYLAKTRKVKISVTYLARLWGEVEGRH
ncbi:MAG: hypothetical protein JRG71_01860 [Deltaproteobacteria bacterium]|nr:hypothetical protein [Deltaproteobacteria bacterium]